MPFLSRPDRRQTRRILPKTRRILPDQRGIHALPRANIGPQHGSGSRLNQHHDTGDWRVCPSRTAPTLLRCMFRSRCVNRPVTIMPTGGHGGAGGRHRRAVRARPTKWRRGRTDRLPALRAGRWAGIPTRRHFLADVIFAGRIGHDDHLPTWPSPRGLPGSTRTSVARHARRRPARGQQICDRRRCTAPTRGPADGHRSPGGGGGARHTIRGRGQGVAADPVRACEAEQIGDDDSVPPRAAVVAKGRRMGGGQVVQPRPVACFRLPQGVAVDIRSRQPRGVFAGPRRVCPPGLPRQQSPGSVWSTGVERNGRARPTRARPDEHDQHETPPSGKDL